MVSPPASIAISAAILRALAAGVFMLFVRNPSANRFTRPRVLNVLSALGFASMAGRRSGGILASEALRMRA
jgi:hypothetical protein